MTTPETKTSASPRPWLLSRYSTSEAFTGIEAADGTDVAVSVRRQDADLIVLAVNEHEGLAEVVRLLVEEIDDPSRAGRDGVALSAVIQRKARSLLARLDAAREGGR